MKGLGAVNVRGTRAIRAVILKSLTPALISVILLFLTVDHVVAAEALDGSHERSRVNVAGRALLQICSRAERGRGVHQHNDASLVLFGSVESSMEIDQKLLRQRVAISGRIEGDRGDPIVHGDLDELPHNGGLYPPSS